MLPGARASLPDTLGLPQERDRGEQNEPPNPRQDIPILPPLPPAAPADLPAPPSNNLPWHPPARLTVGWLKGIHWKIVPRHLIAQSHWVVPIPGWVELEDFFFNDLDHHFRSGSNITQDPTRVNRSSNTSLLDARRTQNIEIMLQSIPIENIEGKTIFLAELMQNIMSSKAMPVRNAMLALQQVQMIECKVQAGQSRSRARDAPRSKQIESDKLFIDASNRSPTLSTLSVDLMVEILIRCNCVRTVLKFASVSRRIYQFLYMNTSIWETFYGFLIPRSHQELSIGLLIKWNVECLHSKKEHVSILEFESRVTMFRTCFQSQLIHESLCDVLRGIEKILQSSSFLYILFTVRFIGNVMNEYPVCGVWSFK
eukprot:461994-Hanusia_phi.AAC.4